MSSFTLKLCLSAAIALSLNSQQVFACPYADFNSQGCSDFQKCQTGKCETDKKCEQREESKE